MSRLGQPWQAQRERDWMQMILDAARLLGWRCYHTFDSRRSESGFPDLLCVRDGRCLVIEAKTERGRVTEAQREWLDHLNAAGIETMVARPSDWDAVIEVLQAPCAKIA